MTPTIPRAKTTLAAVLLSAALTFAAVWLRLQPPRPLPADAPAHLFSAARARAMLARILGDQEPHWLGTPANAAVRKRLIDELRTLGYEPEQHDQRVGGLPTHNVTARLPGATGDVVLLCAHYDSVRQGPGASDDGAGVAALLEAARAMRAGPPPHNTILFLFTDGEEAGLLGARAFAATQAKSVRVVLNFEARGTSGASLMFETSADDAWLVDVLARSVERPVSSSLFATVYREMPNDTDLSVFLRAGLPGMNFAFIGDAHRYHTPEDTLENLSMASLQHHGDNALALARTIGGRDLTAPPAGAAVWFDVLAVVVVRWPVRWSLPIALAVVAGLAVRVARRRGAVRGALLFLVTPILAAALGWLYEFVVARTDALPRPFVATPWPFVAAQSALGVGAFVLARRLFDRGGGFDGFWLAWALAGAASAALLPGGSYLFLVPAAFAALLGGGLFGRVAVAVAVGLVWFPMFVLLPAALGAGAGLVLVPAFAVTCAGVLSARPGPRATSSPAAVESRA